MQRRSRTPWLSLALSLAVTGTLGMLGTSSLGCSSKPAQTKAPTLVHNDSWCPEGFESGPHDTCFAIPEAHGKDTPVLVYLHGMFTGRGSEEEWSLVRGAVGRGFAVVIPRGKRGLCAWQAEVKDHFCWPQEIDDPESFKRVIAEWDRVLWQVDALLEGGTHKRYVLAFSNGGFFASYVATHGLFAGQAYAIVNGGPLEPLASAPQPKESRSGAGGQRARGGVPLLLVAASDDPYQGPKMKELHDDLAKVGWTHAYCPRPGAHGITAADVDAAVRFFKREGEGSLRAGPGGTVSCDSVGAGAGNAASAGSGAAPASPPPQKPQTPPAPATE